MYQHPLHDERYERAKHGRAVLRPARCAFFFRRSLQYLLHSAIFSNPARATLPRGMLRAESAMETELQGKVEKYEAKVVQCEEWARQAPEGPQRTFYVVLAEYYGGLAKDFRQVLAKRKAA
jgi:hypothetical protein